MTGGIIFMAEKFFLVIAMLYNTYWSDMTLKKSLVLSLQLILYTHTYN
nr:MAG TPA: hypothetical protein [Caudoviricetes sp.]